MRTPAQIEASRRNGARSHGPKTPEGKAISSMNALRHGMTAKALLLTNEDPEAYIQLANAYYEKFQPADDVERDLVDEMVIAKWRQRRAYYPNPISAQPLSPRKHARRTGGRQVSISQQHSAGPAGGAGSRPVSPLRYPDASPEMAPCPAGSAPLSYRAEFVTKRFCRPEW